MGQYVIINIHKHTRIEKEGEREGRALYTFEIKTGKPQTVVESLQPKTINNERENKRYMAFGAAANSIMHKTIK